MVESDWEGYLQARFPGYLLPESAARSLSAAEARRFLEGISGRPDQLELLRAVALFAPRVAELQMAVHDSFPALVRALPSRTDVEARQWEGGFHGRLDIQATQTLHLAGRRTTFVTRTRRRVFDLPENLLLRAVCARMHRELAELRTAGALPETGWATGLRDCEGRLRWLLDGTALRHVSDVPIDSFHENSASQARAAPYHEAAQWWSLMRRALDEDDPRVIAETVANGALAPLDAATRFELAVALRLCEALTDALTADGSGKWTVERALIVSGRRDIMSIVSEDGVAVRVYYNQSELPPGPADRGGRHYVGVAGRLRPDITVTFERPSTARRAVVVECKHSSDPSYLLAGYHEAVLYRWEYADALTGWPKAVLVSSGPIPGGVCVDDDVVAVAWHHWVPAEISRALALFSA